METEIVNRFKRKIKSYGLCITEYEMRHSSCSFYLSFAVSIILSTGTLTMKASISYDSNAKSHQRLRIDRIIQSSFSLDYDLKPSPRIRQCVNVCITSAALLKGR